MSEKPFKLDYRFPDGRVARAGEFETLDELVAFYEAANEGEEGDELQTLPETAAECADARS